MNEPTYYTVHESPMGGFYAATHENEAMDACWTGPTRETAEEAAADLCENAAEALRNFHEDSEDEPRIVEPE